MRIKLVLLTIIAGLAFNNVYAFNLVQAWQAARSYNAEYSAAQHASDAGQEQEIQAKAALLPQVAINANYQKQHNTMAKLGDATKTTSHGWNVQLSQPIFDLTKWAEYKRGVIVAKQAITQFDSVGSQLLLDVSKSYFAVLMLHDSLVATQMAKKAYAKQLAQTKARFESSAATIVDTYEAQASYDASVAEELNIQSQLQINKNQLADYTGLDAEKIEELNSKNIIQLTLEQDLIYWQNLAKQKNIELKLQQLELQNIQQSLNATKAENYPKIILSGGYQNNYSNADRKAIVSLPSEHNKGAFAAINLSVPLFAGGAITSKENENAARLLQTQDLLLATERKIDLTVKQFYLNVQSGKVQINAQEKLVQSNKAKLDATQLGEQIGVRSNLDLIQSQQTYADAQKQLAEARYNYLISYLSLLQSTNQLDIPQNKQQLIQLFKSPDYPLTSN